MLKLICGSLSVPLTLAALQVYGTVNYLLQGEDANGSYVYAAGQM